MEQHSEEKKWSELSDSIYLFAGLKYLKLLGQNPEANVSRFVKGLFDIKFGIESVLTLHAS